MTRMVEKMKILKWQWLGHIARKKSMNGTRDVESKKEVSEY